ncbi:hypothetical protein RY831_28690 [Noviherbaspirillum sp. CPCC 100848]|uniref:Uncharacterized protein n=1 Tax=Noviherbaspirillum album TaxID=3080276 RepID=A0ABU6JI51_9BURK|nr:hypothetical protein [Noviherbaspirillum sp. CPCC 100848]MEC4723141.1 hypothetical protein [Noviherbaspirillum sp. CPCC 100848]
MKRIGQGYSPLITSLTHEQGYIGSRTEDEQMTPVENGGWNVEQGCFDRVGNYQQLNKFDYDDKRFLMIPLWRLFLDAFTAAVENGYIDHVNWKQAFRFREDWLALATDLKNAGTEWMHERHQRALTVAILGRKPGHSGFASYRDCGVFIATQIEPRSDLPRLRLV